MPTLLEASSCRFVIVMRDCEERRHVHVSGSGGEAKLWLEPEVELAVHRGYTQREIGRIVRLTRDHRPMLVHRWDEECGRAHQR